MWTGRLRLLASLQLSEVSVGDSGESGGGFEAQSASGADFAQAAAEVVRRDTAVVVFLPHTHGYRATTSGSFVQRDCWYKR